MGCRRMRVIPPAKRRLEMTYELLSLDHCSLTIKMYITFIGKYWVYIDCKINCLSYNPCPYAL